MTERAKELLALMASEYEKSQENAFDHIFYISFPDNVIRELEADGYIVRCNDIVGTIKLTQFGYNQAKK